MICRDIVLCCILSLCSIHQINACILAVLGAVTKLRWQTRERGGFPKINDTYCVSLCSNNLINENSINLSTLFMNDSLLYSMNKDCISHCCHSLIIVEWCAYKLRNHIGDFLESLWKYHFFVSHYFISGILVIGFFCMASNQFAPGSFIMWTNF